ncbi:hypothetical protein LX32DRAFT_693587 [Colletotrichum zoysiae]|uniref:Rhodopsin domain-containing protein n=1 Tax=Colletotrichum zoysiae TaxID=1216348 RepID=A0AAD9M4T1_9PEZI|nr:hypothetical protein LX32DRAFT_693587 [Colletotrichum zoysiae]
MVDVDVVFAGRLAREGWTLYGLGMTFLLLRLYGRARRLGGVAYYQADDYLEILAALFYTLLLVTLNKIIDQGGSNLFPPEQLATFTAEDVSARVAGSKIVLVSEQAMLNVIYALKACVLVFYTRLTLGLAARRFVRFLAAYVAVGWAATQVTMFAACRPFAGYWAVPPPDPQCATYERYAVLQGFFNITSDVLLLLVPLPLVSRMRIAWRQKAVLVFVFGLGLAVVAAALLTKVFNLRDPYSPGYMLWYVREASVAVCVSNLPLVWPLLREWFPCLRALTAPGEVPTPWSVVRSKTVNGSTTAGLAATTLRTQRGGGGGGSQHAAGTVMEAARGDMSFDEFRDWLNAADRELRRPSSGLHSPSTQRHTVGGLGDDPEKSPLERGGRRRSSLPDIFVMGWGSAEPNPRRLTAELDPERGALWSCFGPGQGLYPEPKAADAGRAK